MPQRGEEHPAADVLVDEDRDQATLRQRHRANGVSAARLKVWKTHDLANSLDLRYPSQLIDRRALNPQIGGSHLPDYRGTDSRLVPVNTHGFLFRVVVVKQDERVILSAPVQDTQ